MATQATCPGDDCWTVGVGAVCFEPFATIETTDGERILYDREQETAWIQSDVYFPRQLVV
jgi:hypothetical protein